MVPVTCPQWGQGTRETERRAGHGLRGRQAGQRGGKAHRNRTRAGDPEPGGKSLRRAGQARLVPEGPCPLRPCGPCSGCAQTLGQGPRRGSWSVHRSATRGGRIRRGRGSRLGGPAGGRGAATAGPRVSVPTAPAASLREGSDLGASWQAGPGGIPMAIHARLRQPGGVASTGLGG